MLENLAYLHYSCIYENGEGSEVCLQTSQSWVALPMVVCACIAAQPSGASPLLQYGASGESVVNLQNQLKQAGCLAQDAASDGRYGRITRAAVERLQQENNLKLVDGVAGNETYAALEKGQTCNASGGGLKLGDRGEEVRLMQIQLNNWGFPLDSRKERLQPTGNFDLATQEALREFEKSFALEPDGSLDPQTSEVLWKPKVEALVEYFSFDTFQWVSSTLENLKPSEKPKAVATILSLMRSGKYVDDRNDIPRSTAALKFLGTDATMATPDLLSILSNTETDPAIRASAAEALGYIGSKERRVVETLLTVAKEKGKDQEAQDRLYNLRYKAIEATGNLGIESSLVVRDLLTIAKDKADDSIRRQAVGTIGRFGANAKDAVEPLMEILKDTSEDSTLRERVIITLGEIGPAAQTAIPTLISLLDDTNYPAWQLSDSFQGKDLNDGIESMRATRLCDNPLREDVSLALAKIGTAAVPELTTALQNPDEKVRYSAAFALGKIQQTDARTVEGLKAIMDNPDENLNVRWMAASALESIGQDTQEFFLDSKLDSLDTRRKQQRPSSTTFEGHTFDEYTGLRIPAGGCGPTGDELGECLRNGSCGSN